ncbi:energy transducer TonB [Hymenobacter sp. BT507]|uniref:Energy transducer TonB n=1 Tax=Hymenobacter citatus TaxID=2763506 RepID=A0ABR7MH25_9BACT|nr:energy transducer TonB [Hymenobacter citatus]MBC6610396.1 energy transducer TonB [Hymenobacter citatus]
MKKKLLYGVLFLLPALAHAQRLRENQWEKGMMDKGEKVGVWEYYAYNRAGTQLLVQKYDHTEHKLLEYRPLSDVPYRTELTPGKWTSTLLDRQPMFIGGDARLATYTTKLNYPQAAQNKKLQGRVLISFVIDTLGQASNYQIIQSVGGGCDEEALRVCRTIPNEWIPARKSGRAVPVVYELPFVYKLRE